MLMRCTNILKGNEIEKRTDSAASLLALLPAGHEKREDFEYDAEVCFSALSRISFYILTTIQGNEISERQDTAASLLALLPAGHEKRQDTAASLLALLPAGHEKRDDFEYDAAVSYIPLSSFRIKERIY